MSANDDLEKWEKKKGVSILKKNELGPALKELLPTVDSPYLQSKIDERA